MLTSIALLHDDVFDVACRPQLSNKFLFNDQGARSDNFRFRFVDNDNNLVCVRLLREHLRVLSLKIVLFNMTNLGELRKCFEESH